MKLERESEGFLEREAFRQSDRRFSVKQETKLLPTVRATREHWF